MQYESWLLQETDISSPLVESDTLLKGSREQRRRLKRILPGAIDLGRLRSVLALALGAAGFEGFVAAELAPEGALERAPGVKLAAVGLNLNSLALGFSFETGAVEGLPSAESPCGMASPLSLYLAQQVFL